MKKMNKTPENFITEEMAKDYIKYQTKHYKHDCSKCHYLGRIGGDSIGEYDPWDADLYFCDVQVFPTLIARFGDSPEEYNSGLEFGKQNLDPALREAYLRSVALGLIKN